MRAQPPSHRAPARRSCSSTARPRTWACSARRPRPSRPGDSGSSGTTGRGTGGSTRDRLARRRRRPARRRRGRVVAHRWTRSAPSCSASAPAAWSPWPWPPATPSRVAGHRLGAGRGGHAARRRRDARRAGRPMDEHLAAHPGDWVAPST